VIDKETSMALRKLALAGTIVVLAGSVLAESGAPPSATGTSATAARHFRHNHTKPASEDVAATVQKRLAYIKAELAISENQSAAWKDYADAALQTSESMQSDHQAMQRAIASGSAVERLQTRIAMAESRLKALEAIEPAADALYRALDPEQQKKADNLLGLIGMGWGKG
jgi:hypothetical protein